MFIEEKRVSVHSFVATQKFWFVSEKRGSVHSQLLSENDKSPKPLKLADRQVLKYQIFTHGLKPPKIAFKRLSIKNREI